MRCARTCWSASPPDRSRSSSGCRPRRAARSRAARPTAQPPTSGARVWRKPAPRLRWTSPTRPVRALLAAVLAGRGERIERVPALVAHALDRRLLAEHGPDALVLSQAPGALLYIDEPDRAGALIDEMLKVSRAGGDAFGLVAV